MQCEEVVLDLILTSNTKKKH